VQQRTYDTQTQVCVFLRGTCRSSNEVIREHLYRTHQHPPHCPRCQEEFENEEVVELHLQQDEPCKINKTLLDCRRGFTKQQSRLIKSRKKQKRDETEEETWNNIYCILFPDTPEDAIPSPCECAVFLNIRYSSALTFSRRRNKE
jgi:hypothetical protein